MGRVKGQLLEDDYIEKAAQEIAEEIDFHMIADMLCEAGWIRIEFQPWVSYGQAQSIKLWIAHNCTGAVKSRGSVWLFENTEEALMFKLTFT